jgi:hypothetical protein
LHPKTRERARVPHGVIASGIDVFDHAASILFAFRREDERLTLPRLSERKGSTKARCNGTRRRCVTTIS